MRSGASALHRALLAAGGPRGPRFRHAPGAHLLWPVRDCFAFAPPATWLRASSASGRQPVWLRARLRAVLPTAAAAGAPGAGARFWKERRRWRPRCLARSHLSLHWRFTFFFVAMLPSQRLGAAGAPPLRLPFHQQSFRPQMRGCPGGVPNREARKRFPHGVGRAREKGDGNSVKMSSQCCESSA